MQNKSSNEPLTPLSPNIQVITEYDAIVIRRIWKSVAAYFLIFFALFWNTFMVVWMTIAISKEAWSMVAFGSIHAGVGLGLIYFTIALFINKTDIRIDSYNLSVKHYPLPWFGQIQLPVETLQQVYCKEKITRNKNSTNVSYEIHCLDQNSRSKKLLSGLNDSAQAHTIEREIEKTLGIKDRPVDGEYRK